jgi:hypothetical protein
MTSLLSTCHRSVIFAAENNRVIQSSVPQRARRQTRFVRCQQRMSANVYLFVLVLLNERLLKHVHSVNRSQVLTQPSGKSN